MEEGEAFKERECSSNNLPPPSVELWGSGPINGWGRWICPLKLEVKGGVICSGEGASPPSSPHSFKETSSWLRLGGGQGRGLHLSPPEGRRTDGVWSLPELLVGWEATPAPAPPMKGRREGGGGRKGKSEGRKKGMRERKRGMEREVEKMGGSREGRKEW